MNYQTGSQDGYVGVQIYTDRQGFDAAANAAALVRQYGVAREVKTPDECVAIEPALGARREWIAGGTYTASDESGDARKFTQGLAALAAQRGVMFRFGVNIESLAVAAGAICGLRVVNENNRKEVLTADAYVVCLSSYSPRLLAPVGVQALVYPAKGYSATLAIIDPAAAPTVSITDDAKKIVITRLGDRLRVAGTGPIPMIEGSTPTTSLSPIHASGVRPRSRAADSAASTSDAAPSVMPEEFPACTVPPSRNTGGSLARSCSVVSARGCSSAVMVRSSPFRPATFTGAISDSKRLSLIAAPARLWLSSAKRSCSLRPILY